MTDDKEHTLAEYTRAASTVSRTLAIGTGWMGNMVGYWSTALAVLTNPVDFVVRVWRNLKQYYEEESKREHAGGSWGWPACSLSCVFLGE